MELSNGKASAKISRATRAGQLVAAKGRIFGPVETSHDENAFFMLNQ